MPIKVYFLVIILLLCILFSGLKWGSVSHLSWELLMTIRFPRVLLASAIGAALAVAGVVLQAVFSNPLCDPYTLGISSGAALGAVIGISLGLNWYFGGMILSAFFGSLLFALVLYLVSWRSETSQLELLLTGVVLGFLGSALVTLWQVLTDAHGVQGALFWLLGDLSRANLNNSSIILGCILLLSLALWLQASTLDVLLLGEQEAIAVGVDVRKKRKLFILLTSLLVGVSVSAGGMIGFIGIIIPHFCRRMVGTLHFHLIPISAIVGASAMILADLFSRTWFAPQEIPVGVLTALIGSPLLLGLFLKRPTRNI